MVIFMKISNTNTLGNRLMARNNERRMVKATGERFEMSKKDIINNGVNAKIVKDKMGMLMASQALGDEIASTIRTGMNICAINFAQFIGEDGTLGENAVHVALMYSGLYWKVWDRQTKTVNFEKAAKIVESRTGAKLEPIYDENDIMLAENKYNMKRYIYGVNDYYLRRAEMALSAINANTTLEELEIKKKDVELKHLSELLKLYSVDNTLSRGYSLIYKEDKIIKEKTELAKGDEIKIRLYKGNVEAVIK